jgi:hypothetical protein
MQVIFNNSFFDNRIYFGDQQTREDLLGNIFQKGIEQKGAGIRCYSAPFGWLLSKIGFASNIEINGQNYYVNTNSFCKFVIRATELVNPSSAKDAAQKLNAIYHRHQKNGYDANKLKNIKDDLKQILEGNEDNKKLVRKGKDTLYLPGILARLMRIANEGKKNWRCN